MTAVNILLSEQIRTSPYAPNLLNGFTMKANIPVEVMEVLPKKVIPAELKICDKVRHKKSEFWQ